MIRFTTMLLVILPCTAQALDPRYVEPTGEDVATVKIVGTVPQTNIYESGDICSGHRRWPEDKFKLAPEGGRVDPNSTILKIKPAVPISFALSRARLGGSPIGGLSVSTCSVFVSFTPVAKKHYAISFEMAEKCVVSLSEVSSPEAFDFRPADGTTLQVHSRDDARALCKAK